MISISVASAPSNVPVKASLVSILLLVQTPCGNTLICLLINRMVTMPEPSLIIKPACEYSSIPSRYKLRMVVRIKTVSVATSLKYAALGIMPLIAVTFSPSPSSDTLNAAISESISFPLTVTLPNISLSNSGADVASRYASISETAASPLVIYISEKRRSSETFVAALMVMP